MTIQEYNEKYHISKEINKHYLNEMFIIFTPFFTISFWRLIFGVLGFRVYTSWMDYLPVVAVILVIFYFFSNIFGKTKVMRGEIISKYTRYFAGQNSRFVLYADIEDEERYDLSGKEMILENSEHMVNRYRVINTVFSKIEEGDISYYIISPWNIILGKIDLVEEKISLEVIPKILAVLLKTFYILINIILLLIAVFVAYMNSLPNMFTN